MPIINGTPIIDYVYQEYPKWITLPDGKTKLVEDAHEEHLEFGTKPKEDEIEPEFIGFKGFEFKLDPIPVVDLVDVPIEEKTAIEAEVITEDIETLRKQADDLGLIYDKRWGAVKIRQAIDNARTRG